MDESVQCESKLKKKERWLKVAYRLMEADELLGLYIIFSGTVGQIFCSGYKMAQAAAKGPFKHPLLIKWIKAFLHS